MNAIWLYYNRQRPEDTAYPLSFLPCNILWHLKILPARMLMSPWPLNSEPKLQAKINLITQPSLEIAIKIDYYTSLKPKPLSGVSKVFKTTSSSCTPLERALWKEFFVLVMMDTLLSSVFPIILWLWPKYLFNCVTSFVRNPWAYLTSSKRFWDWRFNPWMEMGFF